MSWNGFCMIRVGEQLPDGLTRDVRSLRWSVMVKWPPTPPKIEENKFVLKCILGHFQCFEPMFILVDNFVNIFLETFPNPATPVKNDIILILSFKWNSKHCNQTQVLKMALQYHACNLNNSSSIQSYLKEILQIFIDSQSALTSMGRQ